MLQNKTNGDPLKQGTSSSLIEGSNKASGSLRACHVAVPGSIPSRAGEAYGDLFLALQYRDCISRGSHDHVNGGVVSLIVSGT